MASHTRWNSQTKKNLGKAHIQAKIKEMRKYHYLFRELKIAYRDIFSSALCFFFPSFSQ